MVISKSTSITLLIMLLAGCLAAQDNRYMVFFKDKVGTPYTIEQPAQFLSEHSIERRRQQKIAIVHQDLPVNTTYINAIKSTGAKIKYNSKWFNGTLMEATTAQRNIVEALPSVLSIEFVAPGKTGTGGRVKANSKMGSASFADAAQNQNSILSLDEMHADGLTGKGVTIAILDTGFPGVKTNAAFADIIQQARILDSYNFSSGQSNAFIGHEHGARVFSIIAGNIPSIFKGGAVDASFLLYATEYDPTEYRVEEYNWAFAAERADSAGADIISSSLGYNEFDDAAMDYTISDLDGKTTVISKAAKFATDVGMVVVSSAGNFGNDPWHFIGPPADVANVLAVGSIDIKYNQSSFSAFGPTADGRIKPDIMALGTGAASILPSGAVAFGNGTSFSCPMISSLVAGIWQKWPVLSAIEIVGLIRKAGSQYFNPNNEFGYGIPTYRAVKNIMGSLNPGSAIFIYPNPVIGDALKIALPQGDGSSVSVILQHPTGQILKEVNYQAIWHLNPFVLDLSDLPPGMYWVKVKRKDLVETFRVVK